MEALGLFCECEIARKDERHIEMSVGLARRCARPENRISVTKGVQFPTSQRVQFSVSLDTAGANAA